MLSPERLATVALSSAPVLPHVRLATADIIQQILAALTRAGTRTVMVPMPRAIAADRVAAAAVIAHEVRLPLFRVSLGGLASKYIGETEKQLGLVFSRVETRGTVLLFDEADALFGKRTGVGAGDAGKTGDASMLLLPLLDRHRPAVVLLGVSREAVIDPAFLHRCQHVVRFPEPRPGVRLAVEQAIVPGRR